MTLKLYLPFVSFASRLKTLVNDYGESVFSALTAYYCDVLMNGVWHTISLIICFIPPRTVSEWNNPKLPLKAAFKTFLLSACRVNSRRFIDKCKVWVWLKDGNLMELWQCVNLKTWNLGRDCFPLKSQIAQIYTLPYQIVPTILPVSNPL